MHARTVKSILALAVLFALLVALLPGAMADGGRYHGKEWMKSHHVERIDMVKTVTGQSGDSVTFEIPTMAIKGKEGEVATITFMTPLVGSYNKSYDMGYISTKGGKSSDIAVRPYDNATLNVSGASVVVSMKDIKTLLKEEDYKIF